MFCSGHKVVIFFILPWFFWYDMSTCFGLMLEGTGVKL